MRRHPGHPWRINLEDVAKIASGLDYFDFMNELAALFTTESSSEKNSRPPQWIIDKNPVNTLHVHHFLKVYPQTKAIFLVRDPRANIASRMESQNWIHGRKNHWMINAHRWRSYNRYYYTLKNQFPDQIHLLRYEDFVLNPQQHLDELCEFLEIPSIPLESPNPITLTNVDQSTARLAKKYRDLSAPINPHAISRWKEVLNQDTLERIEALCVKEMEFYGYARETHVKASIPRKFCFLARWYALKEQLIFHLPVALKLKRIE